VRLARAKDWQGRLGRANNWPTTLKTLALDSNSILGSKEMDFNRPLTLICGPNGVGKSVLLQSLWAASDPEGWAQSAYRDHRLDDGSASVTFGKGEGNVERNIDFGSPERESVGDLGDVRFVNCWWETSEYQKFFLSEEERDVLVEGYARVELDRDEVEQLSALTGKEYSEISLFEIDWDDTIPFFEVRYGADRYDSRSMGTGEICALHAWWVLRRANAEEIFLFDEPEAFLSFGSQVKLSHYIARVCCEKQLSIVICTHSPAFIGYFGLDKSLVVTRGENGFVVVEGAPRPRLLGQLGVAAQLRAIVFVEDVLARSLLIALLEKIDPISRTGVHIDVRGSDGEIVKVLKSVVDIEVPIKFIGVFDGDKKGETPKAIAGAALFLPGDQALERELKDFVRANVAAIGDRLEVDDFTAVVAALEGDEHHDWFGNLAADLGMTSPELFQALVPAWVNDEAVRAAFEAFHLEFRDMLAQ
jgi:predicted ATPase